MKRDCFGRWVRLVAGLWLALGSLPAGAQDPAALAEALPGLPAGASAAEAGPAEAPAEEDPSLAIERAWLGPAASLDERVRRTRRTSLELGVWSLDAAARAVLAGDFGDDPIQQADAAVRLAPDLPAARMARARSLWLSGDSPLAALRTAASALAAIPRHLEASLWFAGSLLYVLALALVAGGGLVIAVAGGFALPHASHDLGDRISSSMPAFARVALLVSLLLAPLLFGEGFFGVALALLALGAAYGSRRQRVALVAASALMVIGAYPVARLAGGTLSAFASDPIAEAAYRTADGFAFPVDLARLEAGAPGDALAARALARGARRSGALGAADAHYQALLAAAPDDQVIANNAANVRLNLGHMESALELYRHAAEVEPSPVVLFNLSQAHGRAFQVEYLGDTLAEAQSLGPVVVAELTALQGAEPEGFVVDLPLPKELMWRRLLASDAGGDVAAALRAPLAPGRLGGDPWLAAAVFGMVALVASAVGGRLRPSRSCSGCGRRQCSRCNHRAAVGELCDGCVRLFHQPETTERALRLARIEALRRRERRVSRLSVLACVFVPGSAGPLVKHPLRGLLGALFCALALSCVVYRRGVVPDPLVAGAAAPFAFLGAAVLAGLAYAIVVALSATALRRS